MNVFRGLVSKKKKRYQKDGFDLDLSYVGKNLIAMGFPSEGKEGLYRNKMSDVKRFFKHYHVGHYKVYNLCSERTYPASHFKNATANFPFDDHNPCVFKMLASFCQDVQTFLHENEKNVVAVHCKAGKGRTGLVLCCYLQFGDNPMCASADEAMSFYAEARTMNKKGVTIPSQRRWVRYFGKLLAFQREQQALCDAALAAEANGTDSPTDTSQPPAEIVPRAFPFNGILLKAVKIIMRGWPNMGDSKSTPIALRIMTMDKTLLYDTKKKDKSKQTRWSSEEDTHIITLPEDLLIRADINFKFFCKDKKMFGFWVHTSFCTSEVGTDGVAGGNHSVHFDKDELDDAVKDKKHKIFPADFSVDVIFEEGVSHAVCEEGTDDEEEAEDFVLTFGESEQTKMAASTATAKRGGLSNKLKHMVSKKKLRYVRDGFDLDLSYINPRIIAMGFPSESWEGIYRNAMKDVKRFLEQKHGGHYKVYNLCSERTYTADKFNNSVACYPFDDHNPCPFKMLLAFCQDAEDWLNRDPDNMVAIHCKAGKGRTGLMISALLIYIRDCAGHAEALEFYGRARTANVKGVTIPSQRRWVRYFDTYLKQYHWPERPFPMDGTPIVLIGLLMAPALKLAISPYFVVKHMNKNVLYSSKKSGTVQWNKQPVFQIGCRVPVCGDVNITFYDDVLGSDDKLFGFWVNTTLVQAGGNDHVVIKKDDLDGAVKDKKHKTFCEDFSVTVIFDFTDTDCSVDQGMGLDTAFAKQTKMNSSSKGKGGGPLPIRPSIVGTAGAGGASTASSAQNSIAGRNIASPSAKGRAAGDDDDDDEKVCEEDIPEEEDEVASKGGESGRGSVVSTADICVDVGDSKTGDDGEAESKTTDDDDDGKLASIIDLDADDDTSDKAAADKAAADKAAADKAAADKAAADKAAADKAAADKAAADKAKADAEKAAAAAAAAEKEKEAAAAAAAAASAAAKADAATAAAEAVAPILNLDDSDSDDAPPPPASEAEAVPEPTPETPIAAAEADAATAAAAPASTAAAEEAAAAAALEAQRAEWEKEFEAEYAAANAGEDEGASTSSSESSDSDSD